MSYSIWLEVDLGGPESVDLGDWNYTGNGAAMWCEAGANLADFHGKEASECIPALRDAIAAMKAEPMRFIPLQPPNGWGSYDTLIPALEELLETFEMAPKGKVVVHR